MYDLQYDLGMVWIMVYSGLILLRTIAWILGSHPYVLVHRCDAVDPDTAIARQTLLYSHHLRRDPKATLAYPQPSPSRCG